MNARDALINYAASTRTITDDGLAPYIDRVEREARTAGSLDQQRELRRLELMESSLIDYINRSDTPAMVGHILTGLLALANGQANDEFPAPRMPRLHAGHRSRRQEDTVNTDPPNIPAGPIEAEPIDYRPSAEQEAILRSILAAAGVELGAYDERIVRWFAQLADWSTFAVVASWIRRAASGEPDVP